jgi:hypothetical protein
MQDTKSSVLLLKKLCSKNIKVMKAISNMIPMLYGHQKKNSEIEEPLKCIKEYLDFLAKDIDTMKLALYEYEFERCHEYSRYLRWKENENQTFDKKDDDAEAIASEHL